MSGPVGNNVARVPPGAVCGACGYALAGLASRGVCPECGAGYPPHLTAVRRRWTAFEMCVLLGWPLAGGAVGLVFAQASAWSPLLPLRSTGLMVFGLMSLAVLVNTPVQMTRLMVQHAAPGRRVGNPLGHLRGLALLAVMLVAAVPFLLVLAGVLIPLGSAIFGPGGN